MKKIFENFYLFSKLALSLSLLICLFGALYIIYINYQKESKISENQIKLEETLIVNINKNSDLINNIAKEIKLNEIALSEIKKNIENLSSQEKEEDISNLNNSINLLNDNFDKLSEEIRNIKNNNFSSIVDSNASKPNLINSGKIEIIDLILVKYENNIQFNQEIEYLRKIITDSKVANLEKIIILSSNPFRGHQYLKKIFNEEVNIYLKKIINKKPNSLFSKIILPYIEISPTSENIITSDLILKIKEIKLNIENKNIEDAIKNLKTIEDYENIFKISSLEINKYLDFKTELLGMI